MHPPNKPAKNILSRTKLATAISLSILLAGCGSGDAAEEITEQAPLTFSGKAADGYLVGALVCLDLNNDSVCGASEPNTLTGVGGAYEFDNLDPTLDLSQVRLLVKVIAEQTIDEDNPDAPVSKSYSMSSPPGQIDFVSPITTLIDNQMQTTAGQTQEQAEQVVAQMIGVEDASIDLTADYVAASEEKGETTEGYQRLHHVAQAVATAIAVVSDNLENQIDGLADSAKKDALAAIVGNVVSSLGEITTAIDQAAANNQEVNISAIVESVKETITIAGDDLEQAIGEVKDLREAVASNVKDVLSQPNGIFFLEQDKERFYNQEINKCVIESELGYGNFKVTEGVGEFSFKLYNSDTQQFEAETDKDDDHEFSLYTLGQSGWELNQHEQPTVVSFSDDGVELTIQMPRDGAEKISALEFDIVGQPVATIARDQWVWQQALASSGLTFGDEAKAYFISGELVDDHFVLPVWHSCSDATGALSTENCNSVRFGRDYQTASDFEQLITMEAPSEANMLAKAFHIYVEDHHELLVSLFQYREGDHEKRVAKFFKRSYEQNDSANYTEQIELLHLAQWQQQTINGQAIILLELPSWLNDAGDGSERETPFITIQDGMVRQGFMLNKGFTDHKAVAMNAAAIEQVIAGFSPQALRLELDPGHCGVESDQPATEPEHETETKPSLISDPAKTNQLVNNSYFIDDGDEQILVHFKAESVVDVSSVELGASDNERHFESGEWTIAADGQLLLEFSDEWVLVKVQQGLGSEQVIVTQQDDGETQELTLNRVTPLLTSDLTANTALVLSHDEQCSLTFNPGSLDGSQGGGYIDASQCSDISQDMGGAQFDFTWAIGDHNEMVLTVYPANQTEQQQIHLFTLSHNGQAFVLMTFDEVTTEGTVSTQHDFELWQLEQATQD